MNSFNLIKSPWRHPWESSLYGSIKQGFPNTDYNSKGHDIIWGVHRNGIAAMKKKNYSFVDMPYYHRIKDNNIQKSYWRWSFNSVHDTRKLTVSCDRFESWNVDINPWKKDGDFILVCPSSQNVTKYLCNTSQKEWIDRTCNEIKKYTNRKIKIRHKPRKSMYVQGPEAETVSMKDELKNCYALVTLVSITAIDSLLEGVPVFSNSTQCPSAWCTNLDISNINNIAYNNREELFFNLAYKQFSIPEYQSGYAYKIIKEKLL